MTVQFLNLRTVHWHKRKTAGSVEVRTLLLCRGWTFFALCVIQRTRGQHCFLIFASSYLKMHVTFRVEGHLLAPWPGRSFFWILSVSRDGNCVFNVFIVTTYRTMYGQNFAGCWLYEFRWWHHHCSLMDVCLVAFALAGLKTAVTKSSILLVAACR